MASSEQAAAMGQRIREAYIQAGYNRSQFVRALDVAYTTVLAWEQGRSAPGPDNLSAVAHLLGVSAEWLLDGRESARRKTALSAEAEATLAEFLQRPAIRRKVTDHQVELLRKDGQQFFGVAGRKATVDAWELLYELLIAADPAALAAERLGATEVGD